jgi:[NiFe] hydrogenase diaphorase moiety small subunit
MSKPLTFKIDGRDVSAQPGQTILEAADAAGVYIPRLCSMKGLAPHGSCRVCTVKVNGRAQSACTQPAAQDALVESETAELQDLRRSLVEMLFAEGNHYCPCCEKSGNCELQATAYRLGITAFRHPFQFPKRDIDATHPAVYIDRDRCILCGRCVQASRDLDRKGVFEFVGRGIHKRVEVNADRLGDTDLAVADQAAAACPVGAIVKKHQAFRLPVGQRLFDHQPIGAETESQARTPASQP